MNRAVKATTVAVLAALLALVIVEPALAKTSDVGKNIGDEVKAWGAALLLGVACLVGLPALAKREVSQSLVIALIVFVLGGFIFASEQVKGVIDSLWNAFGG